jgi:hypothetical protein
VGDTLLASPGVHKHIEVGAVRGKKHMLRRGDPLWSSAVKQQRARVLGGGGRKTKGK